jgi:hypothetical protein
MNSRLFSAFVIALLFASSHLCQAETQLTANTLRLADRAKAGSAKISDVAWMTGNWTGSGLGATCHESWGQPHAGSMMGTFVFEKDNKVEFSEFFMLSEEQGTLVLKLKHFGPDMIGWEKKDKFLEFRLVKVDGQSAWFDGLTYRKNAKGELHVFLAMKTKDGKFKEAHFVFRPDNGASTK